MPICQLCLKEKKLIESHIFPAFIYKYIYGDKNNLILMSFDKTIKEDNKNIKSDPIFSGEYDKEILCKDCDNNIIGSYESTSAKILINIYSYFGYEKTKRGFEIVLNAKGVMKRFKNSYFSISKKTFNRRKYIYTKFEKLDYLKFKKFLLSILFKTAISNRVFSQYVEIEEHLELLRSMLKSNHKISEKSYPIIIQSYLHYSDIPKGIVAAPILIKEENYWCVKLLVPGLLITIFLNQIISDDGNLSEYILKEEGTLRILHINKKDIIKYFSDYKFFNI